MACALATQNTGGSGEPGVLTPEAEALEDAQTEAFLDLNAKQLAAVNGGTKFVDPASLGLLAVSVVMKAAWKAYTVYKERFKWDNKLADAKCIENLEEYQKLASMLKFMRVAGLVASAGSIEKEKKKDKDQLSRARGESTDALDVGLVDRLESVCQTMLHRKGRAYWKIELNCQDHGQARSLVMLADLAMPAGFSCQALFEMSKQQTARVRSAALRSNSDVDASSAGGVIGLRIAQKGAFRSDPTRADVMSELRLIM
eukprot:g6428.t1